MSTLVVLAAGQGRRFGGDKQLAPVGPGGEPLLWYALQDAARAGFSDAVLVIREGLAGPFHDRLAGSPLPLRFATQATRRPTPWGTGHALLAAASVVTGSCMVINADDYYGAEACLAVARFLSQPPTGRVPEFALVAYPLGTTLSPNGPVNRAICRVDGAGMLRDLEEQGGLVRGSLRLPLDTPVSMNCWGFTKEIFPLLRNRFELFQRRNPEEEFMLPAAIADLVRREEARVRVLAAAGPWFGLTYPADLEPLARHIAHLSEGESP